MKDNVISEERLNQIESEVKNELTQNPNSLFNGEQKPHDDGKHSIARLSLGDLGTFKKISKQEADEIFEKLDGFVFKIKNALFKTTYIQSNKRRFTVELINEE